MTENIRQTNNKYFRYNIVQVHKACQFLLQQSVTGYTESLTSHVAQIVGFAIQTPHLWDLEPHRSSAGSINHPAPKLFLRWQDVWWEFGHESTEMGWPQMVHAFGHSCGRNGKSRDKAFRTFTRWPLVPTLTTSPSHISVTPHHSLLPNHILHFASLCLCPHLSLPGLPSPSFIPWQKLVIFKAQLRSHGSSMPSPTGKIVPSSVPNIMSWPQQQWLLCLSSHGWVGSL